VTIPPLQISNSVATHVSHANRLSHVADFPEFLHFILEKITANGAVFADGFLCSRRAVGDAVQVPFLRQDGASHSEALQIKE